MLAAPLAYATASTELPRMGNPADRMMSPAEERQLGREIVRRLRTQNAILDDTQANAYIDDLGHRLAAQSPGSDYGFDFFIVDDPTINAFALPGGFVGVNRGLLTAADDESEVAGVLAHEIAHVTQRHIVRGLAQNRRTNMITAAAVLAAIIAGGGSADVTGAALSGGLAASFQNRVNYTFAMEQEADRVGMQILAESGFDPEGMSGFFEKLQRRARYREGGLSQFIRTHPVTTERIAEARARARQYPEVEPEPQLEFHLTKARLDVQSSRNTSQTIARFRDRIEQADGDKQVAARYGLALALVGNGDAAAAHEILQDLAESHPGARGIVIAKGRTEAELDRPQQAFETFEAALRTYPENEPLVLAYAEVLLSHGEPERAREILQDLPSRGPNAAKRYRLLAKSAEAMGRTADSHYYLSEYYTRVDAPRQALEQIKIALDGGQLSDFQKARLQARRKEIESVLEQRQPRRQGNAE